VHPPTCNAAYTTKYIIVYTIFTAQRICVARTMPLQDVRPFVRLSVSPSIRPSHVGIMSTLLTISSFVYPQVAPDSSLSVPNSMAIGLGPHYGCVVLFTG